MADPTTTRLQAQPCPSCDARIDAHTAAHSTASPKPGDVSVCLYCAAILRYGDDLTLELVPDPERTELLEESEELANVVGLVLTRIATRPDRPEDGGR